MTKSLFLFLGIKKRELKSFLQENYIKITDNKGKNYGNNKQPKQNRVPFYFLTIKIFVDWKKYGRIKKKEN